MRNKSATVIQKTVRGYKQRKAYLECLHKIRTLQIYLKYKVRKIREYRRRRLEAVVTLQSVFRMMKARAEYKAELAKWVRLQSLFRNIIARIEVRDKYVNNSATVIQSYFKAYLQRRYYKQLKASAIKLQLKWRSILARNQLKKLHQESKSLGKIKLVYLGTWLFLFIIKLLHTHLHLIYFPIDSFITLIHDCMLL